MPARILVSLVVLTTIGLALWCQAGPADPLLPTPTPPARPVINPVIPQPSVAPLQPVPLLPASAVRNPIPPIPEAAISSPIPSISPHPPVIPVAPRPNDPLLELNDHAGIDDLIQQLRQVREKKAEVEQFERQLVSKLQEKVRQQSEKLKELGVVETDVSNDP